MASGRGRTCEAGARKGADPHYNVTALADIKALPVGHLAPGRHPAVMVDGRDAAAGPRRARRLGRQVPSQIVWRKVTKNGKVRVGTGYRLRGCHEPVLLASFGGRQTYKVFPSIFEGLAHEHSRKPNEWRN